MIYTWILIKTETGVYIGWSKAIDKPMNNNTDVFEWEEWGKDLPDDIDENAYTLTELEALED